MFIADLVRAIPWSSVAGVATLLTGMAFIAAGLRYDRAAPARVRREERR
jgi:hypothetical protein